MTHREPPLSRMLAAVATAVRAMDDHHLDRIVAAAADAAQVDTPTARLARAVGGVAAHEAMRRVRVLDFAEADLEADGTGELLEPGDDPVPPGWAADG